VAASLQQGALAVRPADSGKQKARRKEARLDAANTKRGLVRGGGDSGLVILHSPPRCPTKNTPPKGKSPAAKSPGSGRIVVMAGGANGGNQKTPGSNKKKVMR
jgi:hypothetical protein